MEYSIEKAKEIKDKYQFLLGEQISSATSDGHITHLVIRPSLEEDFHSFIKSIHQLINNDQNLDKFNESHGKYWVYLISYASYRHPYYSPINEYLTTNNIT